MSFHKEENNNLSDFKNAVLWKLVVLLINWERKYTSYVIKRFTSVPAFLGNYPVTFTDHLHCVPDTVISVFHGLPHLILIITLWGGHYFYIQFRRKLKF